MSYSSSQGTSALLVVVINHVVLPHPAFRFCRAIRNMNEERDTIHEDMQKNKTDPRSVNSATNQNRLARIVCVIRYNALTCKLKLDSHLQSRNSTTPMALTVTSPHQA
jgi:hypothetical protein